MKKQKVKEQILQELETALAQEGLNEGAIQTILEKHPELIPTPFLLNHGLHHKLIIKKHPLPNGKETDFLYLSKSTVKWQIILVELESSNKRIFNSRRSKQLNFHGDFNTSYDQIISWKAHIEQNKELMKASLMPLLGHMHQNNIEYKFVLIIGRNSELDSQVRKNMFNQKNSQDILVLTYDSLINIFQENPLVNKVIASKTTNGYHITNLNNVYTLLLATLECGTLSFDNSIREELLENKYNLTAWESGKLLVFNGKQPLNLKIESNG